jgi:DNA-binding Lrp family transcriptional regulator
MAGKPQRWTKWFFSDWRSDAGVRSVSLQARGLWIDMLALMDESPRRGFLEQNGRPMSIGQLANNVGAPNDTVEQLLRELEDAGVFSRDGKDIIYSRRITRDLKERGKERERKFRPSSGDPPDILPTGAKNGGVFIDPNSSVSLSEDPENSIPSKSEQALIIWELYPRKVGKKAGLKAIAKALKTTPFETLREATEAFGKSPKGRGEFCPHPSTWFNEGRWEDDRRNWRQGGSKSDELRRSLEEGFPESDDGPF